MAIDSAGRLWVVSHGQNQLVRISAEGTIESIVSGWPFRFPHDVALDAENSAYVSDGYARTIWKVDETGQPQRWISGEPLAGPVGLAWRGEELIIVDPKARAVFAADRQARVTSLLSATTE